MDEDVPVGRRPMDSQMFRIGAQWLIEQPEVSEPDPQERVLAGAGTTQPESARSGS